MDDVRAERFAPHAVVDADAGVTTDVWAFAPLTVAADRRFPRDSVSIALDTSHTGAARRDAAESAQASLARAVERERAFRVKEIAAARRTLDEAARAETYEQNGNLLLANLGSVARGAASVTLPDFYGNGGERTIPLDPKHSPQENAEGFFEKARKARDAAEYAEGRIADREDELASLDMLAEELGRTAGEADVERLRDRLAALVGRERAGGTAGAKKKTAEKPFHGHRVRTFALDGGYELLVGETAEANDHLTTRVAAPADLWLHVRAGTGAHGVLRTQGKPAHNVPEAVVRRAAEIVAARSGKAVKHAGTVAVDVVERRHVRKPRGAKPGLVTYTRERTLDVTPAA
jgi:predicted ribosome quality control (RQC) complex YloA/Tae2 family protein